MAKATRGGWRRGRPSAVRRSRARFPRRRPLLGHRRRTRHRVHCPSRRVDQHDAAPAGHPRQHHHGGGARRSAADIHIREAVVRGPLVPSRQRTRTTHARSSTKMASMKMASILLQARRVRPSFGPRRSRSGQPRDECEHRGHQRRPEGALSRNSTMPRRYDASALETGFTRPDASPSRSGPLRGRAVAGRLVGGSGRPTVGQSAQGGDTGQR